MSLFQESEWQPSHRLAPEEVAYFRQVLLIHANDPKTGICAVCGKASCEDWRAAYDQLAVAGELMAEPSLWLSEVGEWKPGTHRGRHQNRAT
jgi:hypothetical protein